MKNKILIRADGGSSIGLGHLIRCQALGEILSSDFKIEFYCKEIPDSLLSNFKQKNLSVNTIQEENEFLDVLNGDEIVVLDHYGLDTSFQKIIKEKGNKLVCIDDLHDKEFYADLIINHAPRISKSDYKAQPYTHFALGPTFAILRPKFLNAALNKREPEELDSIFVCFGGADPLDCTYRITEALLMCFGIHKINIVIGAAYSHSKIFELAKKDEFDIQIHNGLNEFELVDLMMKSDMAIAPSSTILYELISVKIPILSGYFTENQKFIFDGFKKLGCIYPLGDLSKMNDGQFINRISKYINKRNHVKLLKAQEEIIDGKSKERLINIFRTIC